MPIKFNVYDGKIFLPVCIPFNFLSADNFVLCACVVSVVDATKKALLHSFMYAHVYIKGSYIHTTYIHIHIVLSCIHTYIHTTVFILPRIVVK